VLPSNNTVDCSFSPDGVYLAVAVYSSIPYITIYKRNGDVFTKLPNPSELPTGRGSGCSFSPDRVYLAVSHSTAPFVTIYRTDTKEIVSKVTDLGVNPVYWLTRGKLGVALETKNIGEQIKVNLFPKLNNLIGG